MPELGSAASLSEASIAVQSSVAKPAKVQASSHHACTVAQCQISALVAPAKASDSQPAWAVVAMRHEVGDKLEHEEGAP